MTTHKPAAKSELSLVESDYIFVQFNTQWVFGTALCIQIPAVTMWKAQSQSSYAVNYMCLLEEEQKKPFRNEMVLYVN